MQKGLPQALDENRLDLNYWAHHTLDQIYERMETQGTWPFGAPGPYAGYSDINEKRRKKGRWYSTGAAAKRLYAHVYNNADGNTEKIQFFYDHYLDFVQWGVGKGRKLEDVIERTTKARFNKRLAKWGKPTDMMNSDERRTRVSRDHSRKSRPSILMEFRHQALRLEKDIIEKYYFGLVHIGLLWTSEKAEHAKEVLRQHESGAWMTVK